MLHEAQFFNEDCVEGCRRHIPDSTVDLIVTDPPYGIQGHQLHKHYNRKEEFVLDGYVEVPAEEYPEFTRLWISEAERILRPGGSIYIVSGYTHLVDILVALRATSLREVNHLVWKYNFGVYTSRKYISSHYHILYYVKPGRPITFNTGCRYGPKEQHENGGSLNYLDREDVWVINREYKPGQTKNKNALPSQLLIKIIQYSSNEGDLVCDLFLGSFSTAKVAIGLNRRAVGFEKSSTAFSHQVAEMKTVQRGGLLDQLRAPALESHPNQGKPWSDDERRQVYRRYVGLLKVCGTKGKAIEVLSRETGRGRFSLGKAIAVAKNGDSGATGQLDFVEIVS
ncbi:MAG: site-specific DNA-methyltransferase [Candidatus Sumerlaeota bacterium]|nr:site-specific DNA-methyltransferase [Candidatus Sumerlaeota bacterium]